MELVKPANQLLVTKLFVPTYCTQQVLRPRLFELLEQGLERKLTLICAQAGFGKTTLLVQWHQSHPQQPLFWVSLDENDNEPLYFLRYLVAAFRNLIPDETEEILTKKLIVAVLLMSIIF